MINLSFLDQCNPESIEDLVTLLVPELQKRGLYWNDYPAPEGTLRENMQQRPGQPLAAQDHIAAKLRWDKVKPATVEQHKFETPKQNVVGKAPVVTATEVLNGDVPIPVRA